MYRRKSMEMLTLNLYFLYVVLRRYACVVVHETVMVANTQNVLPVRLNTQNSRHVTIGYVDAGWD